MPVRNTAFWRERNRRPFEGKENSYIQNKGTFLFLVKFWCNHEIQVSSNAWVRFVDNRTFIYVPYFQKYHFYTRHFPHITINYNFINNVAFWKLTLTDLIPKRRNKLMYYPLRINNANFFMSRLHEPWKRKLRFCQSNISQISLNWEDVFSSSLLYIGFQWAALLLPQRTASHRSITIKNVYGGNGK